MRLPGLTCWCVLLVLIVACDPEPMPRSRPMPPTSPSQPKQPSPPSQPMHPAPAEPVAGPEIRKAPARHKAKPAAEVPTVAPENEPEPKPEPDAIDPTTAEEHTRSESRGEPIEIPESSESTGECCRTCRKGKACGDTCVARDRECTVAPGCACDAE